MRLKESLMGHRSCWYYHDFIDYDTEEEKEDIKKFQFVYIFYERGMWTVSDPSIVYPLLEILEPLALIKLKANLQTRSETFFSNSLHTDAMSPVNPQHVTGVYYLNTCNGKTIFESGQEVDSVANRLLIFNPNERHCGTSVTDSKTRCVININFIQNLNKKWLDLP